VFNQIRHLVEQLWISAIHATLARGELDRRRGDRRLPRLNARDNTVLLHDADVVGGIVNDDGRRTVRAQTAARPAAGHAGVGQWYYLRSIERHQPAQWTAIGDVRRIPAHTLAKRQASNTAGQCLSQDFDSRASGLLYYCCNVAPALIFHNVQGCDIDATAASKPARCRRGLACLIKGTTGRWPLDDSFQVGLTAC